MPHVAQILIQGLAFCILAVAELEQQATAISAKAISVWNSIFMLSY